MSPRTVVHIQENMDGSITSFSLDSPKSYPMAGRFQPLASHPGASPFQDLETGDGSPNWVLVAGQTLFDDLSAHPAVGPAIKQALLQAQGGCSPIHLWMHDVTTAEQLPWEAVYLKNQGEFLALDDRWPIVRVREANEPDPRLVYDFEPPLRITAVMSASGDDAQTQVPAAPQWQALYAALQMGLAAPGATPIELTVFVGEESLRSSVEGLGMPWIKCGYITDRDGLLQSIRDSRPHILHFFCHGTSDEIPHLQIGSFTDWEAGRAGTVPITAAELRQRADPKQGIWLVALNCCESAAQARDGRRLASSLVAAGFPAALGMRERIDLQLAHTVCSSFYPAILALIDQAPAGGPALDIEWAQALSNVRSNLAGASKAGVPPQLAARDCKTWTIPAFYARREPFRLKRIVSLAQSAPGLSEAKKRQIDYIQELQRLRTKAADDYKDLPPEALRDILADFDSQLAKATARLTQTK